MRAIHLSLVMLVCMSAVYADITQSHAQTMDLNWLDPVLVTQIGEGKLILIVHDKPDEIEKFRPTTKSSFLHAWRDPETNDWQYKIIRYTLNADTNIIEIKESGGSEVNFEGSFTDTFAIRNATVVEKTEVIEVRAEEEPTLGPEPTPTPSFEPNPESSATQTGFEGENWQETSETSEKTATPPKEITEVVEPLTESNTVTVEETKTETAKEQIPVTFIQNGEVVTVFRELVSRRIENSVFVEATLTWNQEHTVSEVTDVIAKFTETYGQELETDSYTLFNNIASTETDKYWSEYNYWNVKDSQLEHGIRAIAKTFKTAINQKDVTALAQAIRESKSENGYVAFILNSDSIDNNTEDGWTIHAEMFAAAYNKDSDKVQFFAWSGSKSGIYVTGRYSEFNKLTVKETVKRWLFAHVGMLVRCNNSPVEEMAIWSHPDLSIRTSAPTITKSATASATMTSTSTATGSLSQTLDAAVLITQQSEPLDASF